MYTHVFFDKQKLIENVHIGIKNPRSAAMECTKKFVLNKNILVL